MSEFKSGDKVIHAMFGRGVVAAIAGSGPDARVTVDFAPSIGRKKLLASVANLQKVDADLSSASASDAWFEELQVSAKPRIPRCVESNRICNEIRAELARPVFWIAVRERLRARGQAPKAIDDPNNSAYVSSSGLLNLSLVVRHDALADARDGVASRAIFDELAVHVLREFEAFSFTAKTSIQCPLDEEDRVILNETKLGEFPARESRMRPKRVQPKGVITSLPRRRDDY